MLALAKRLDTLRADTPALRGQLQTDITVVNMSDNGQAPATKEDLAKLRDELLEVTGKLVAESETRLLEVTGKLVTESETRLLEAMGKLVYESETRLLEAMGKLVYESETRLLKAFYGFAESNRREISDLTRSDSSLRERLDTIENRVLQIEKRLNFPQPPSPASS